MTTQLGTDLCASVYCFVADGIQSYIMERSNLREMVGASAIISSVSDVDKDSPFCTLLDELNIKGAIFGRRGGGGLTVGLTTEAHGQQLLSHWPLVVEQLAPGLNYAQAVGKGDTLYDAWKNAMKSIARQKRRPTRHLPPATAVVARSPRTGLSAVSGTGASAMDRVAARKRKAAIVAEGSQGETRTDAVAARIVARRAGAFVNWLWPRDLDTEPETRPIGLDGDDRIFFPYRRDLTGAAARDLAVMHFDGNGFGVLAEALNHLGESDRSKVLEREQALSCLMDELCTTAMAEALEQVIKPEDDGRVPVRPLILAGEDVTLIIRADLAMSFAQVFTETFEQAAKEKKQTLTISGGIAFVKAGFPFDMALQQAEQLCDNAKKASRQYRAHTGGVAPSTLAFQRVAGALVDDESGHLDWHQPLVYLSGLSDRPSSLPRLNAFMGLARLVAKDPPLRSACRRLLGVWQEKGADDLAKDEYVGLLKNLGDRQGDAGKLAWLAALAGLIEGGTTQKDLPIVFSSDSGTPQFSPLYDLVTWLTVGGEVEPAGVEGGSGS